MDKNTFSVLMNKSKLNKYSDIKVKLKLNFN